MRRFDAARSGTVVADGQGILATDEPIEFARYVIDLLRDGGRRAEMELQPGYAAVLRLATSLRQDGPRTPSGKPVPQHI